MKVRLNCTLREHVVTDDHDFVPAGTPVTILGWATGEQDRGLIEVRAAAYVHNGDWDSQDVTESGLDNPATGSGLYLAVYPSNLLFAGLKVFAGLKAMPSGGRIL
jgi:hypothetical protein